MDPMVRFAPDQESAESQRFLKPSSSRSLLCLANTHEIGWNYRYLSCIRASVGSGGGRERNEHTRTGPRTLAPKEMVNFLLTNMASVNDKNLDGMTPLHVAAKMGLLERRQGARGRPRGM